MPGLVVGDSAEEMIFAPRPEVGTTKKMPLALQIASRVETTGRYHGGCDIGSFFLMS